MDNRELFRGSGSGFYLLLPLAGSSSPAASCALAWLGQQNTPLPTQCSPSAQPASAALPHITPLLTLGCGKAPPPTVSSFFPLNPSTLNLSDGQSVHICTFSFFLFPVPLLALPQSHPPSLPPAFPFFLLSFLLAFLPSLPLPLLFFFVVENRLL